METKEKPEADIQVETVIKGVVVVVGALTILFMGVKIKSQGYEIKHLAANQTTNNVVEYNVGRQPEISQCEYIISRKPGQMSFEIVCHKGDCKHCIERDVKLAEIQDKIYSLTYPTNTLVLPTIPPVFTNK